MHFEAGGVEDIVENVERAGVGWGYRGTADEIAGNGKSVSHAPA
jgi:hypothetical protein